MTLTKALNSILEGEHTAIISKVKSIISRPEFAYQNPYDYHSFRETVLKWCKILAEEGIGNIAYPKENGGEADMHKYFVAMETPPGASLSAAGTGVHHSAVSDCNYNITSLRLENNRR